MKPAETIDENEREKHYMIVCSDNLMFEKVICELNAWGLGSRRGIHLYPVNPCDPRELHGLGIVDVEVTMVDDTQRPVV